MRRTPHWQSARLDTTGDLVFRGEVSTEHQLRQDRRQTRGPGPINLDAKVNYLLLRGAALLQFFRSNARSKVPSSAFERRC
jgi:hypothetical protein